MRSLRLKYLCALYLLLLILCATILASAQSTNATASGVVVDTSGKVITDADIEVLNEATGVHYSSKTNGSGIYTVSILPPGQYRVQVSKDGFKTIIKPGIVLNVQSAIALNFTLPIGATSESVTVEASGTTLNSTNASVGTVIDQKFVENIPLNGRSFQSLISMTPGVSTQSPQSGSVSGYNGDFTVNGQRTESNYYMVDGVSANSGAGTGTGGPQAASSGSIASSTALGTSQSLISVDALQEFRVQSSSYSAEFGRSPGGQFSLETRSGTNQLHGSAYDYLRNDAFDANDWFNNDYKTCASAKRFRRYLGWTGSNFQALQWNRQKLLLRFLRGLEVDSAAGGDNYLCPRCLYAGSISGSFEGDLEFLSGPEWIRLWIVGKPEPCAVHQIVFSAQQHRFNQRSF
jgi:hypothetical protein